jgi:hypothetical protein
MIFRVSPGNWKIWILNMSGNVIVDIDVPNPGMNYGSLIQGGGEVSSRNKLNDMGISDITSLLWKRLDDTWQSWYSWDYGTVDSPYWARGIQQDPNAYIKIGGNQGNPIPTDAPCP